MYGAGKIDRYSAGTAYFRRGIIEWKYESMGKKESCDETDLQKKSDHYHDAGGHDRGSALSRTT